MNELLVYGLLIFCVVSVACHVATFLYWNRSIAKVGRLRMRCWALARRLAPHDPGYVQEYWGEMMIRSPDGGWEKYDA